MLCLWGILMFTIYSSNGLIADMKYTANPTDMTLHCVNYTYTSGSSSAIKCALEVSIMFSYGHGFHYQRGICHACRTRDALGARSFHEYMLKGKHYIRSNYQFLHMCAKSACIVFTGLSTNLYWVCVLSIPSWGRMLCDESNIRSLSNS